MGSYEEWCERRISHVFRAKKTNAAATCNEHIYGLNVFRFPMKIHVNVTGSGKKHVDESYVRGKK